MLLVRAPRASIARVLAAALVAGAASIGSATAQDTNKAAELLLACQSEDGSIEKRVTACAALAGDKAVDVEMRVEAYLNLGLALETKGDEQAAVQAYTDTIALDATNSVAYFNRGNVLDRLGQADRALADYNKAIELEPTDGDYFNNRGLALLEAGDAAKALDDFNQARPQRGRRVQRPSGSSREARQKIRCGHGLSQGDRAGAGECGRPGRPEAAAVTAAFFSEIGPDQPPALRHRSVVRLRR